MEASILTQGLKRRGFIMGLAANCSDSEIAPFRNVDICFVFKIKKKSSRLLARMCLQWPNDKRHSRRSDIDSNVELQKNNVGKLPISSTCVSQQLDVWHRKTPDTNNKLCREDSSCSIILRRTI